MSFDRDVFLELMPDTVSIQDVSSRDKYGKRSYGTAASYRARVREKLERIMNLEGREDWAKTKVWIAPNADGTLPTLTTDSKVTLPDGSTPPILAIERIPDEDGYHHMVVWFGDTARIS